MGIQNLVFHVIIMMDVLWLLFMTTKSHDYIFFMDKFQKLLFFLHMLF